MFGCLEYEGRVYSFGLELAKEVLYCSIDLQVSQLSALY